MNPPTRQTASAFQRPRSTAADAPNPAILNVLPSDKNGGYRLYS
jgi:hypothetical protein